MKRVLAVTILLTLLFAGCKQSVNAPSNVQLPTEDDSIVKFEVYPETDGFETVGKFERAQYNTLSSLQKSIYIALDNAIYEMSDGYIQLGKCSKADVEIAYHALRTDRPEYFWLPSTYKLRTSSTGIDICFAQSSTDWLYSKADRVKLENEIKNDLTAFLSNVDERSTQYERELMAHDFLLNLIEYDHTALEKPDTRFFAWSIIGAFKYEKAVCEGYSKALQLMCFMMGIDCTLITGVTTEPHMWNLVKIDGKWYHVDPTSNDAQSGSVHFFFNVTTEYMLKGRTIDPDVLSVSSIDNRYNLFLPNCNTTDYNYHIVNSSYIASMSQVESTIISHICSAVRSGRRTVEFSVDPKLNFVFGSDDAANRFKLDRCISAANAELSSTERIRSYSFGGVKGALGFVILW